MSDGAAPALAWSVLVLREDVPEGGRTYRLEADEEARAAIARDAGLEALQAFTATIDMKLWKRNGLRAKGTLKARATRLCVVSLEPFEEAIEADFERSYRPEQEKPDREIAIDPESEDPPDPLPADGADLVALVIEEFILALDPHPRKPGIAFEPDDVANNGDSDDHENPFSVLKKLKNPGAE